MTAYRTQSIAYPVWRAMRRRCSDPGDISFCRYGARGIKVCERWDESFENFITDMGDRPAGYDLDRIDNDGNYEPGNCRWVSHKENCRNRSNNRWLTFKGETRTVSEWAEVTGFGLAVVQGRLREGWSVEDVLSTPPRPRSTWSVDEVALLRTNYSGHGGLKRCTELMPGRSRISIAKQAAKLGLTKARR